MTQNLCVKMVKMVNFELCALYHNDFKKECSLLFQKKGEVYLMKLKGHEKKWLRLDVHLGWG